MSNKRLLPGLIAVVGGVATLAARLVAAGMPLQTAGASGGDGGKKNGDKKKKGGGQEGGSGDKKAKKGK